MTEKELELVVSALLERIEIYKDEIRQLEKEVQLAKAESRKNFNLYSELYHGHGGQEKRRKEPSK